MLLDFWQRAYEVFSGFWQWLHDTSPGQATFIGSVFGFLALLGGPTPATPNNPAG